MSVYCIWYYFLLSSSMQRRRQRRRLQGAISIYENWDCLLKDCFELIFHKWIISRWQNEWSLHRRGQMRGKWFIFIIYSPSFRLWMPLKFYRNEHWRIRKVKLNICGKKRDSASIFEQVRSRSHEWMNIRLKLKNSGRYYYKITLCLPKKEKGETKSEYINM